MTTNSKSALHLMPLDYAISDDQFVNLLHGYEATLYRMAFLYTRNEHDALEAVSETVYKAYKGKNSLKTVDYFHTWITRVLINTCLNQIKGSKLTQGATEDFLDNVCVHSKSDEVEWQILLTEAIKNLKPDYKTVILLRFYQELSIKETAKIMGKGENTVKTLTRRALQELKTTIGEDVFYE
ncbi:sigma-70 family RNA polymerase sigma factor [Lachnospiraceae bacterium ZAX-1]